MVRQLGKNDWLIVIICSGLKVSSNTSKRNLSQESKRLKDRSKIMCTKFWTLLYLSIFFLTCWANIMWNHALCAVFVRFRLVGRRECVPPWVCHRVLKHCSTHFGNLWGKWIFVSLSWGKLQEEKQVNLDLCQLYSGSDPERGIWWMLTLPHLSLPTPCKVLDLPALAGILHYASMSNKASAFLLALMALAPPAYTVVLGLYQRFSNFSALRLPF